MRDQDHFEDDRRDFEARGLGVYSEPQAEKAWGPLLALYGKALA